MENGLGIITGERILSLALAQELTEFVFALLVFSMSNAVVERVLSQMNLI